MAFGLAALLDDIAVLAKAAAASLDDVAAGAVKASTKAVGVVIDDTAVTPQYVEGIDPKRELPMIKRIATGSLRNKAIIIVVIMLLSQFLPWTLTPLLMAGGTYLAYEGAHKIWGKLGGHDKQHTAAAEPANEDALVKSAVTTDFILSAEIMVISLNEVTDRSFGVRLAILILVALLITALVYGVVAILVKMDDVGLHLSKKPATEKLGRFMVKAMPKVLAFITVVGTFAMLWVGGHIILVGIKDLGWAAPYDVVHHLETLVPAGFLAWIVNTLCSLVIGFIWGTMVVGIMKVLPFKHKTEEDYAKGKPELPVVVPSEKK